MKRRRETETENHFWWIDVGDRRHRDARNVGVSIGVQRRESLRVAISALSRPTLPRAGASQRRGSACGSARRSEQAAAPVGKKKYPSFYVLFFLLRSSPSTKKKTKKKMMTTSVRRKEKKLSPRRAPEPAKQPKSLPLSRSPEIEENLIRQKQSFRIITAVSLFIIFQQQLKNKTPASNSPYRFLYNSLSLSLPSPVPTAVSLTPQQPLLPSSRLCLPSRPLSWAERRRCPCIRQRAASPLPLSARRFRFSQVRHL